MTVLSKRHSQVIVNEIDLTTIVTNNSTSVAAQVVVSKKGRTTPKRFVNGNDYLNHYGLPDAKVSFDLYCGKDYFSEGTELWGVRVVGEGAKTAGVILYQDGLVTKLMGASFEDPEKPEWETVGLPANATPIALFYPNAGPGSYGDNLAIGIVSDAVSGVPGLTVEAQADGGLLPAGTYQYQIAAITSEGESLVGNPVTSVISGAGTTNRIVLSWNRVNSAIGYRIYGRTDGANLGLLAEVGQFYSTYEDTGAVTPNPAVLPITDPALAALPPKEFLVQIFDMEQNIQYPVEEFLCTLEDATDDNGAAMELEDRINPFSEYIQVTSNVIAIDTMPDIYTVEKANMVGGDSGSAPTSFDVARAWEYFSDRELFGINLLINGGHSNPAVQRAMDSLAQSRGDCVALLDVPSADQQWQRAVDYRNLQLNLNSSYSALFSPDVLEADYINGKQQYVPFSGWAAALCARTDRIANPSFSIAGLNRGLVDVLKTRYTYSDNGEKDALFSSQINYTKTFVGGGIALWEQQTLQKKTSALSWLSVRRIVNTLKVAIWESGQYILQEPNDDFTRATVVTSFSEYLQSVVNARGISWYRVTCDNSNNTPAMAIAGVLKATVEIVPIIPVSKLVVDIVLKKEQGVDFEETQLQLI